jgi:hypothetical protein
VTGRENEAVAVEPARIGRVNLESLPEEDGPDIGCSKWKSKMTRLAGGHGINGKPTGIAGGELEKFGIHKKRLGEQPPSHAFASLQEG